MLEDVLEDCYGFLSTHPTETVIFAVKQEYGDVDRCIQEDAERWYLGSELPSLGEACGRIIPLRWYDDEAGLGMNADIALIWPNQNGYDDPTKAFSDQDCSVGGLPLAVQDRYDEEEKWAAFCAETGDPDAFERPTEFEQTVVSCSDWVGSFFAFSPFVSRVTGFFSFGCHVTLVKSKQIKIRVQNV